MSFFKRIFLVILCFPLPAQALEVSFEEDHSLPLVYLNVLIRGGIAGDPKGKSGLGAFMGQMLLRGTHERTEADINHAMDRMGAQLEVDAKAEAVILRGAVLSSQLDSYLTLLKDLLADSAFPESEIQKLRLQRLSMMDEEQGRDSHLAGLFFRKLLFQDHPYGYSPTGRRKEVEQFTKEDIQALYQKEIVSDNLALLGSGDTSSEKLEAWAKSLSKLLPHTPAISLEIPTPKNPEKRTVFLIDKPDRSQTQLLIGQIGITMKEKHFFPLYIANEAFGGTSFNTTLMNEIRTKRGWSYAAYSYFGFGVQPRFWQTHLFPASRDTAQALNLTLELISDLKMRGLTQEEFDFHKKRLLSKSGFMFDTPEKRVENQIIEKILELPPGFIKSYATNLEKVSLSEVNSALTHFLSPENLTVVILGTESQVLAPIAKELRIPESDIQVIPYTEN